jgi:hypothetical protein
MPPFKGGRRNKMGINCNKEINKREEEKRKINVELSSITRELFNIAWSTTYIV